MTSGLGFCLVLYGIGFSSVRVLARFLLSDLGSVYFGSWQNLCSSLVHSCWIRVLSPSLSSSYCETITMTITTTTFRFWLTGQFTRDHSRRGRPGWVLPSLEIAGVRLFTCQMPFLWPFQQHQSTEGNSYCETGSSHSHNMLQSLTYWRDHGKKENAQMEVKTRI